MFPQGLSAGWESTVPPLLLSGQYDSTMRLLTTVDDTLDSNGNVEAPVGWFALVELPSELGEREALESWLRGCDETHGKIELPDGGWYLYTQDNQGLSMVYECEDYDHAALLYSLLSDRYTEYEVGELTEREQYYLDYSKQLAAKVNEDEVDDEARIIMARLLELDASAEEIERVRTWRSIKQV
jgi:hypothetical protein